jgi:DNA replication and repair protein RecF
LEGSFLQEVKNRHTVYGVHRDDLGFSLGGYSLKDFGSQGQVRSAALCLKLAEANVIQERNNEAPVLILDDVLSELDGVRRGFVLNHIQNTQVFITCCNLSDLSGLKEGYAWRVEQGVFTPIQI